MLSNRQQHILRFVHEHTLEHGFAPSIREISLATGITSTSVVNYDLERLITWGCLVKSRGKSRALGLTERGSALFEPNYPIKSKRTTETFTVDAMLDTNLPDRDAHQLHKENLLLRAESERLRRESKNRVAALQREIDRIDFFSVALYMQHSAGVERTVRKWADQVSEELQRMVIWEFLDVQTGSIGLSSPRLLIPAALDPLATGYRATLERYVEHVTAMHQLQALGYLEEFNARMELARLYLRQLTWAGACIVLIIIGLLSNALLQGSGQAPALIAILTAMLLLLYGLLLAYIRYVLAMAEAALKTLRAADGRLGVS